MKFDILAIKEYTDEYEVLKHEKPEIRIAYSALVAFHEHKPNWEAYPEYSVLKILNDIRRIDRHCEEHPKECIAFIEEEYIYHPVNQLFLALIGIYITNPVFLLLLENRPSIKVITNSQKQTAIKEEINAAIKDLSYELELISTHEVNACQPQQNFADYLHHENKEGLMKKLHELLEFMVICASTRGRVCAYTKTNLQEVY